MSLKQYIPAIMYGNGLSPDEMDVTGATNGWVVKYNSTTGEAEWGPESAVPGSITLADGHILVGDVLGVATDVAVTGAITIDNTGLTSVGTITFTGDALATHQHAAVSAGTPAGTVTGEPLNLATPAFSGTGLSAAGQVVSTTDNQTMTLNQCAGMWLIPATGATPAVLILSNTAVVGAPAVLTVQGVAMTDAGAYKIVKNLAPTFSGSALGTHQHAAVGAGTPSGSIS